MSRVVEKESDLDVFSIIHEPFPEDIYQILEQQPAEQEETQYEEQEETGDEQEWEASTSESESDSSWEEEQSSQEEPEEAEIEEGEQVSQSAQQPIDVNWPPLTWVRWMVAPARHLLAAPLPNSSNACRYGKECYREYCRFDHPEGWVPPQLRVHPVRPKHPYKRRGNRRSLNE